MYFPPYIRGMCDEERLFRLATGCRMIGAPTVATFPAEPTECRESVRQARSLSLPEASGKCTVRIYNTTTESAVNGAMLDLKKFYSPGLYLSRLCAECSRLVLAVACRRQTCSCFSFECIFSKCDQAQHRSFVTRYEIHSYR